MSYPLRLAAKPPDGQARGRPDDDARETVTNRDLNVYATRRYGAGFGW